MNKIIQILALVCVLTGLLYAQQDFRNRPKPPEHPDHPKNADKPDRHRQDGLKPKPENLDREFPPKKELSDKDQTEKKIEMMTRLLRYLKDKLGLTDEQFESLKKILVDNIRKQEKLKKEMETKEKELRDKQEAELKELLGDKYKEFTKLLKDRKTENSAQKKDPSGMNFDYLAKKLEMTDNQLKEYKKALDRLKLGMEELRKSAHENQLKPEDIKSKVDKLHKQFESDLNALLTDEQIEKLKNLQRKSRPDHRNRPDRKFSNFGMAVMSAMKELELSDEQKKKIQKLFMSQAKKMRDLMEALRDSGLKPNEQKAKIQKLQEDFEAELKQILTAKQWKKYLKIQNDFIDPKNNEKDVKNSPKTLDKLLKELELKNSQKKKIEKAMKKFREDLMKLKMKSADNEEVNKKVKKLQNELDDKLKNIFSKEQLSKYKKWRNDARKKFRNKETDRKKTKNENSQKFKPSKNKSEKVN